MNTNLHRKSGFTLIEILIVLVIIAILAAILFPAFSRARENARQANCTSNLNQIRLAVAQYKSDYKQYPASLAVLLPSDAKLDMASTSDDGDTIDNTRGTGDIKSLGILRCPNEERDGNLLSSYGDVSDDITKDDGSPVTTTSITNATMGRYVWNYWGYNDEGIAYNTPTAASAAITSAQANRLVYPTQTFPSATPACSTAPCYDKTQNPIKRSMSNRFAPADTIITHCVNHRYPTSGVEANQVYAAGNEAQAASALDIVLYLDGSVKREQILNWKATPGWTK